LGVDDPAFGVDAEAFLNPSAALDLAGFEIDSSAGKLLLCLRRRRSERGPWRHVGPGRLNHRREDRHREATTGRTATERPPLAAGIVIAEPDCDRYLVGEPDEPGIVFIVGGAGLAGDRGR